jgi:Na+/phosphate symporter
MFHTTFNVILAIIWTPLLSVLLQLLHKIYPPRKSNLHLAIESVNTSLPEEVLSAVKKDIAMLLEKVELYNRHVLYLDHIAHYPQKTHDDYIAIKEIEEKLLKYIVTAHTQSFSEAQ